MKKMSSLILLCLVVHGLAVQASEKQPVDYVDPFLGTSSSRWMLYPGPSMPFGMVKLSPDNTDEWGMDAGYEYSIESICGFGHVHSWMMGSFLTMPTTGPIKILPGSKDDPDAGYRSRFRHENEKASPGYYSVFLDDYGVLAELTASTRGGFQRYTFPKTGAAHVLFDLQVPEEGRPHIVQARIQRVSDAEIAGYVQRTAGWNEYTLYFVARFNRPFDAMGGWKGDRIFENIDEISVRENMDIGAWLDFSTQEDQVVLMKTGISYVSIDQARLNLETELDRFGWDFDAVHRFARRTWNDLLQKIRVQGGSETDKVKFYTNMYRAYCARSIFSDVDGKYTDMCENVRQLDDPNSPVYGCDAFWNTFWNLNQLWALITPETTNKWVKSLLEIYDRGGWLPKGPAGVEYSGIMVASHEIALIVGAYQKGIRNYDVDKAYAAIRKIQTTPGKTHECSGFVGNRNLETYMSIGYVPEEEGPVSNTMEYAYDDWCVAQMARALGKTDDYRTFMQRSQYYRNVFDPSTGYVRPKHRGGPWVSDFTPVIKAVGKEDNFGTRHFVEGNAWQYTWFAPHDVPGLIDLLGQKEFNNRLNQGFELAQPERFVSPWVNHSNQPNMQAAYLFNYSGKPWLTQKWTREILDRYYGTGPVDGYPGDEDQGQMGAWYVMSAIGLFEMDGGAAVEPVYEIGSPLFERTVIQLDENYYPGGQFVIEAKNASGENRYVQSATLNGEPLHSFWFPHAELVKGGELVLVMGPEPNKAWGVSDGPPRDDLPPIVTTPYLDGESALFLDKTTVSLACDTKDARIFYTLDGSEPTQKSRLFREPFTIDNTITLNMKAFVGDRASLPATVTIEKAELKDPVAPGAVAPGIAFEYYTGFFQRTNDFVNLEARKTGVLANISLQPRDREQYFAFMFDGFIDVPADGLYTFHLQSNDGSVMLLDGRRLINNDGLHGVMQRSATVALKAGLHPIRVLYFQEGGTHLLRLYWQGEKFEKQRIPDSALFHAKKD